MYASETTARKYLEQNKVAFFKLKEKPLLESGDYDARKKWVDSHKGRTTIDNKSFQMVRCRRSREFVARRSIRGAYQKNGTSPKKWLQITSCICGAGRAIVLRRAGGVFCSSLGCTTSRT